MCVFEGRVRAIGSRVMRCFCVYLAMLSWDFFLPLYPCQFAYEQGVWDTKILNTKTSGPLMVGVTGWSLVATELMITPVSSQYTL